MGTSIACTDDLGQWVASLFKRWIGTMSRSGVSRSHPLGKYLDGRTSGAATRKRRGAVVLEGSTGGIRCTVTIGQKGKVEIRLEGLPQCLVGTKPFLTFPVAARAEGIAWASGPGMGIVRANAEVAPDGELRCSVARSRSRADDLPKFFSRIRILSEEGKGQPACALSVAVHPRKD